MILHLFESSYTKLPACIFRAPKTSLNWSKPVLVSLHNFPKLEDQRLDCSYSLDQS